MPLWDKENYGLIGSLNPKQNVSQVQCGGRSNSDGLRERQDLRLRSGQNGTLQPLPLGRSNTSNVQAGLASGDWQGAPPHRIWDTHQEQEHRARHLDTAYEIGCTPAPRSGATSLQGYPVAPRKLVLDSPISEEPSKLGNIAVQSCPARAVTRAAGTRNFVRVRVRRTLNLQSGKAATTGSSFQSPGALTWAAEPSHLPKLTASQSVDLDTSTDHKQFIRKRPDTPWKESSRSVRLRVANWDAAAEMARLNLH